MGRGQMHFWARFQLLAVLVIVSFVSCLFLASEKMEASLIAVGIVWLSTLVAAAVRVLWMGVVIDSQDGLLQYRGLLGRRTIRLSQIEYFELIDGALWNSAAAVVRVRFVTGKSALLSGLGEVSVELHREFLWTIFTDAGLDRPEVSWQESCVALHGGRQRYWAGLA